MFDSQPCGHWMFTLERKYPDGGSSTAYFLQADSRDQVPPEATDLVELAEGHQIYFAPDGSSVAIHSHTHILDERTVEGYHYVRKIHELLSQQEQAAWLKAHPRKGTEYL